MNGKMDKGKSYGSSVDSMFFLSLWICLILYSILMVAGVASSYIIIIIGSLICLPIILIQILLYFKTRYIITEKELIIVSPGSRKEYLPIDEIGYMRKVNCTISAKALSSERIEITMKNNRRVYISPVDRDGFLDVLRNIKENL